MYARKAKNPEHMKIYSKSITTFVAAPYGENSKESPASLRIWSSSLIIASCIYLCIIEVVHRLKYKKDVQEFVAAIK
jgi:hypothetical protein